MCSTKTFTETHTQIRENLTQPQERVFLLLFFSYRFAIQVFFGISPFDS